MAVADLIKAFSLSDSSVRTSSSSTTTQVVGLLSVLAISGSVALLTFGSRLRPTADVASTDASEPLKIEDTEESITDSNASELSEMNGRDGTMGAAAPLKLNGSDGLLRAGEKVKMNGRDQGQRGKARRKRVRFADDVVEPRGNGQEYRMRFAQNQHVEGGKRQPVSNSIPANRMALYKGLRQYRLQQSASFYS